MARCLGLALAAGADADPAVAATLHGAADHQYEQAGQAFDTKESKMRSSDHARLRDALGEAVFDAAYQLAARSAKPMPWPWPWAQPSQIRGLRPP